MEKISSIIKIDIKQTTIYGFYLTTNAADDKMNR